MRKFLLISFLLKFSLLLWLTCCSYFLAAQETDSIVIQSRKIKTFKESYRSAAHNNVLKFSPVSPLVGQIPIAGELRVVYERFINYNNSITLGASLNYISIPYKLLELVGDTSGVRLQLWGGRGQVGYRYYPLKHKEAPDGLWFGAIASYNYARISNARGNARVQTFSATFVKEKRSKWRPKSMDESRCLNASKSKNF
jgi:hypothetical protein